MMKFKNHLESIKVTLVHHTSIDELMEYIPEFCSITWNEGIEDTDKFLQERAMTRYDMLIEMFEGRTLPTALETVRLTFFIEGLDLTGVTHLIRHRMFSFSAQSTDPVSMEDHDILDNDAFVEEPDLYVRANTLMRELNKLYIDALDRGLSFYDARHYMPRAKEHKYFMSGNIKDFLHFLKIRLGEQNQPTSDRILALLMRNEIKKVYPMVKIPHTNVEWAYVNAINHKMNLNTYPPNYLHRAVLTDKGIKWTQFKFSHYKERDKYPHIYKFKQLEERIIENEKE